MPKAKKPTAPVQPVAPAPPPVVQAMPTTAPQLPVLYDKLEIAEYSTASPKGPLDVEWCKAALGWETEKEYQERMVREKGGRPEHYLFGDIGIRHEDGSVSPVHCKNVAGEKVVAKHNAHNRPFDEKWAEALVHTILNGQWAGPFTIPGGTVNGETVRISEYGRTLSGQHSMTALILAGEWLLKMRQDGLDPPTNPKYPTWRKHGAPFIETIVIKGMSEDPRVLMTVDYVKPRTAADVFYTSEVFKACTAPERKELCKMLASAVDMLWSRTDAKGYRTHPEVVGFLERHRRLLDCVTYLFGENKPAGGRKISKLRLSPGNCAALMYLMASGTQKTADLSDEYRNSNPPTEKSLDWSYWDQAEKFWTLLANGRDFMPVRMALGRLVESEASREDNQGLGGRGPEKLAIVAKAWERWKDFPTTNGAPFSNADLAAGGLLSLSYGDLDDKGNKLPDGQIKLLDLADFGGIDCPTAVTSRVARTAPPEPPPPTKAEMDRMYEEARARRGLLPST